MVLLGNSKQFHCLLYRKPKKKIFDNNGKVVNSISLFNFNK